jgi:integrase
VLLFALSTKRGKRTMNDYKELLKSLMVQFGSLLAEEEREKEKPFKPIEKDGIIYLVPTGKAKSEETLKKDKTRLKTERMPSNSRLTTEYTNKTVYLQFTKKEVNTMSKNFKKVFILNNCTVSCRQRQDKNSTSYEIRYRKQGYNISVSGRTMEIVKARFLAKIKEEPNAKPNYPLTLNEFTYYFFENYKSKKVCEKEFKKYLLYFNNDIKPFFNNAKIKNITPLQCQKLIDGIIKQGKKRKAEDIKSILNQIFDYARKLGILTVNPVELIVYHKHERKHGKAFTKEEEKELLERLKTTPYYNFVALVLYTGLRPCEWSSIRIGEKFIYARNCKRKNGQIEEKKIPITPMLRPYLTKDIKPVKESEIQKLIPSLFPLHKAYDLRTTFFNRCIECGILDSVRDKWLGHKSNSIKESYTDISEELHLSESDKFFYTL